MGRRGLEKNASLAILQNVHGWVAKQAITIDVDQRISITAALAEAERRVVDIIENNPSERLASRLDAVHQVQR